MAARGNTGITPPSVTPWRPPPGGGILAMACCCPSGGPAEHCPPVPVPPCPSDTNLSLSGCELYRDYGNLNEVWLYIDFSVTLNGGPVYQVNTETGIGTVHSYSVHVIRHYDGQEILNETKTWPEDAEDMKLLITYYCDELDHPFQFAAIWPAAWFSGYPWTNNSMLYKSQTWVFEGTDCLQDKHHDLDDLGGFLDEHEILDQGVLVFMNGAMGLGGYPSEGSGNG